MREPVHSLRALHTLVAVVDSGSFTAAAERLHYSQSAVSSQIQRLEQTIGIALLSRTTRRLTPTPTGREVLGYAREMLRLDALMTEQLAKKSIAGKITLGLPADFAVYIPETLSMFAERHPRVELDVRSDISEALIDQVANGSIDMAIVTRGTFEQGGLKLRREPLIWVTAPGSNAHLRDPLPLALWPDGTCAFRGAALGALTRQGRDWRLGYESQAFNALRASVLAGLTITVAIPSMIDPDLIELKPETGSLPVLPEIDIRLVRQAGPSTSASDSLAELIVDRVTRYKALAGPD